MLSNTILDKIFISIVASAVQLTMGTINQSMSFLCSTDVSFVKIKEEFVSLRGLQSRITPALSYGIICTNNVLYHVRELLPLPFHFLELGTHPPTSN